MAGIEIDAAAIEQQIITSIIDSSIGVTIKKDYSIQRHVDEIVKREISTVIAEMCREPEMNRRIREALTARLNEKIEEFAESFVRQVSFSKENRY